MSEHDASPSCGHHSARYSPVAMYISRGAGSSIVRILCLSHMFQQLIVLGLSSGSVCARTRGLVMWEVVKVGQVEGLG